MLLLGVLYGMSRAIFDSITMAGGDTRLSIDFDFAWMYGTVRFRDGIGRAESMFICINDVCLKWKVLLLFAMPRVISNLTAMR